MGEGTQTVTTADFPWIRLVIMLKYSIDVKYYVPDVKCCVCVLIMSFVVQRDTQYRIRASSATSFMTLQHAILL